MDGVTIDDLPKYLNINLDIIIITVSHGRAFSSLEWVLARVNGPTAQTLQYCSSSIIQIIKQTDAFDVLLKCIVEIPINN